MFELIAEDFRSYKRPLLAQGFWACLIHRLGVRGEEIAPGPLLWLVKVFHIAAIKWSEVFFGIYIGQHAVIGRRFVIDHFGGIVIHSSAVIGDDVRVRQNVTIGNKTASRPMDVPVIGNRVEIGAGAVILGAISIGDDVVVGANAVVIRDVPANFLAIGVPSRLVPRVQERSDGVVPFPVDVAL